MSECYVHGYFHGSYPQCPRCYTTAQQQQLPRSPAQPGARELLRELSDELGGALSILGTGNCKVNTCEGCLYETKETIGILQAAVARIDAFLRGGSSG